MDGFKYSQNLIQETIQVFKEEDGLDISAETANEYLDSLGGLFLAFANKKASADSLRVAGASSLTSPSLLVEPVFPKPKAGLREPSLRLDITT